MKHRLMHRLALFFLVISLIFVTGLIAVASSEAATPAFSIDVQGSAERVIPLIEEITDSQFPEHVRVLEVTVEGLVDVLMKEWDFAAQQTDEEVDPLVRVMAEYQALKNARRILGKYCFIDKNVYIVTENLLSILPKLNMSGNWQVETVDAILAHELAHANDDFRFGTGEYYASLRGDGERALAYRAVAEGNAVYVASEVCRRLGYQDRSRYLAEVHEPGDVSGLLASSNLSEEMLMYYQYSYGERFMRRLYEEGGAELAAKAFLEAPLYSSQIFRPEQYLSELPVLPDLKKMLLQADNFLPEGDWDRAIFVASELVVRLGFSRLGNELAEHYLQGYLTGLSRAFSIKEAEGEGDSGDGGSGDGGFADSSETSAKRRMLVTAFYYLDPLNAAEFLEGEEQLMLAQWSDIAARGGSEFQKVRRLEPGIGTGCIWSEANYIDEANVATNDQQIFLQCGNLVFEVAMFNMHLTDAEIIELLQLLVSASEMDGIG